MGDSDPLGEGLFYVMAVGLVGFGSYGFDKDVIMLSFIILTLLGVLYLDRR
ncbi:hypothetical protein [Halorubrum laminariae]|uniref:Uncharacterized protein n=1 Tax=Halorubrum laminariae TaxID=1433523 RepID=A0ABD6BXH7_9EURY|nr:hypothetical protein [Halorubrum laminariae]